MTSVRVPKSGAPMDATSPITLAIARFEDLLALGLQVALERDPNVLIVAHAIAPERIDAVVQAHHPRVLVLDVDALRDLARVRELSLAHPGTRLVLIGQGHSNAETAQLLAFGASAYLPRTTQTRDLINAVHLAARGMQLQRMPSGPGREASGDLLMTAREGEVLTLLREDRSNAQIALALHISVETVRSHARNIYRKLGVSSRRALLALPAAPAEPGLPAAA